MPKVSVVVPVYNIESFLPRCLDSLIQQSMKDMEIFLIDDGSTDNSGLICDEYASKDSRIQVIHKSNEGLAAARNDGIDLSTAPYVMFVDGDDWVEPEFCEKPYVAAVSEDAEIVIFDAGIEKKGKKYIGKDGKPVGMVDPETALKYGGSMAWNKLYKREVFDNIRYPVGHVYEDVAVTYKILFLAKHIVMISDILYWWVFRKESISHSHSAEYKRDAFIFALQRAEDLKLHGCAEETYMPGLWTYALRYIARADRSDDSYYQKAEGVIDGIKGIPAKLTGKLRIMLLLWKMEKRLFHFVCRITGYRSK